MLLVVLVTGADVQDRDAGLPLLEQLRRLHHKITLVWADGAYAGRLVDSARDHLALTLTVVRRTRCQHRLHRCCPGGGASSAPWPG